MNLIEELGIETCRAIVDGAPEFIRNSLSQDETMYNPRTKKYIERGPQSVLIQLDGEDEYYHSTMPYHSSFYAECIFLKDLRTAIQQQLQTELNNCSEKDSSEISITDDCTDIRNHISPRTIVWDLASGEDWSAEVKG